jgi:hypothetical protein
MEEVALAAAMAGALVEVVAAMVVEPVALEEAVAMEEVVALEEAVEAMAAQVLQVALGLLLPQESVVVTVPQRGT